MLKLQLQMEREDQVADMIQNTPSVLIGSQGACTRRGGRCRQRRHVGLRTETMRSRGCCAAGNRAGG